MNEKENTGLKELINILNEFKKESTKPEYGTKKTGDYRIGLSRAITEAYNLIDKEKEIDMINIRVFIESQIVHFDENVFVDIQLPAVPKVGETLCLYDSMDILEQKAKSSLDIISNYAPDWFYGHSGKYQRENKLEVKEEHIKDFSFGDAIRVRYVEYRANDPFVYIELGKD